MITRTFFAKALYIVFILLAKGSGAPRPAKAEASPCAVVAAIKAASQAAMDKGGLITKLFGMGVHFCVATSKVANGCAMP